MTNFTRTPRTPEELQQLITEKPPGWEYISFGSYIYLDSQKIDYKWQDHQLHISGLKQQYLDDQSALNYVKTMVDGLQTITSQIMLLFTPDYQVQAFGKPGEPGDPAKIENFAKNMVLGYENYLDWSSSLRSISVSRNLQRLLGLVNEMSNEPIQETHDYIETIVKTTDQIADKISNPKDDGRKIVITLDLKLTIDDSIAKNISKEMKHLR